MSKSPEFNIDYGDSESSNQLRCSICHQPFSRLEHLRRHTRVHVNHKPYKYAHCDKTFGRKDAARRHENTHRSFHTNKHSESLRRSCSACAASRVKCSGDDPCSRCVAKGFGCKYLPRKSTRLVRRLEVDLSPSALSAPEVERRLVPVHTTSSDFTEDFIHPQNNSNSSKAASYPSDDAENPNRVDILSDLFEMPQPSPNTSMRATNWLPFDAPRQGHTAPLTVNDQGHYHTAIDGPPLILLPEDGGPSMADTSPSLRHDRISNLIASMRTGLPGLSHQSHTRGDGNGENSENDPVSIASRYADGAGARSSQSSLHMFKRQRVHSVVDAAIQESRDTNSSWIETLQDKIKSNGDHDEMHFAIPAFIYQEILSKLDSHQSNTASKHVIANSGYFMQKESLELFIHLYFKKFHAVYPFLDSSLLSIPVWGWSLCLATAAIGARFLSVPDATIFGDNLGNFLNDTLVYEIDFRNTDDSLPFIQARILTTIGMCLSCDSSVMSRAYNTAPLLFNACLRLRILKEDDCIGAYDAGQDLEQIWIAWRFRETRRRTGLFIWVVDCLLAFMSQSCPRLPLRMLNLRLPSDETLWEAETCNKWLGSLRHERPSGDQIEYFRSDEKSRLLASDALKELWTTGSISQPLTQFGRIVIISMLIQRAWDTVWFLNDPGAQPVTRYLAAIPEYTKWRNATCDSLDVLHWEALSISARNGGVEDPVFLHLHLGRLLLLIPVREFFDYIRERGGEAEANFLLPHDLYMVPEPQSLCEKMILAWAHNDRYKARLAVIHAGAIFWHVRRYSSDSFAQPFSVCLATITLWMYGTYSSHGQQSTLPAYSPHSSSTANGDLQILPDSIDENMTTAGPISPPWDLIEGSPATNLQRKGRGSTGPTLAPQYQRMPRSVQLDRPIDDELVQYFIRSDEKITLFLEGVPDLCTAHGASQLLQEGISLLDEISSCWPISKHYSMLLNQLLVSEIN